MARRSPARKHSVRSPVRSGRRSGTDAQAVEVVRYRDDIGYLADWTRALSQGRVFVNTKRAAARGQRIVVRLSFPQRRLSVRVDGRVQWIRPFGNDENLPPGMCVSLDRHNAEVAHRLQSLAERLAREGVCGLRAPACWNPEGLVDPSNHASERARAAGVW